MPRIANQLRELSTDELADLEAALRKEFTYRKLEIERCISLLDGAINSASIAVPSFKKRGVPKGTRLPVKYRGPNGEEWTGRGVQPRWFRALLDDGRSPAEFLVEVSTTGSKTDGADPYV